MQGDFTLVELSTGLTLAVPHDLIVAEHVFLVTLLLEYFGECTIRVTVLLEYLSQSHIFYMWGYLLFYNSLIFNSFLLSFCKGSLLCLVHLHSNFQLIPPRSSCDIGINFDFFFKLWKINQVVITKVGLSFRL